MKTMKKLLALAVLSPLAACASNAAMPAPPVDLSITTVHDVVPVKLHNVAPTQPIQRGMLQHFDAVSPRLPLERAGSVEPQLSNQVFYKVEPGSRAQQFDLPVGNTTNAWIYLASAAFPDVDGERATLEAIQIIGPDGDLVNVHVKKTGETAPEASMDLTGRPAGVYKAVIGDAAAFSGVAVTLVENSATVLMQVGPSKALFFPEDDGTIEITISDGATPVAGAQIDAQLVFPGDRLGPKLAVTEVGHGAYRAHVGGMLDEKSIRHIYNVRVTATGTSNGQPFSRFGSTAFQFGVPTAKMTNLSPARAVLDEHGKIAYYDIDVTIDSAAEDRYRVSGILVAKADDGTERPVAVAEVADVIGVGQGTLTLRFDAGIVKLTEMEGTLSLRNLELYSQGSMTVNHRLGMGGALVIPNVHRAQLADLTDLPPAVQTMVDNGSISVK